eukprot:PhF_6_TR41726/c0_g1_i1/m.63311
MQLTPTQTSRSPATDVLFHNNRTTGTSDVNDEGQRGVLNNSNSGSTGSSRGDNTTPTFMTRMYNSELDSSFDTPENVLSGAINLPTSLSEEDVVQTHQPRSSLMNAHTPTSTSTSPLNPPELPVLHGDESVDGIPLVILTRGGGGGGSCNTQHSSSNNLSNNNNNTPFAWDELPMQRGDAGGIRNILNCSSGGGSSSSSNADGHVGTPITRREDGGWVYTSHVYGTKYSHVVLPSMQQQH